MFQSDLGLVIAETKVIGPCSDLGVSIRLGFGDRGNNLIRGLFRVNAQVSIRLGFGDRGDTAQRLPADTGRRVSIRLGFGDRGDRGQRRAVHPAGGFQSDSGLVIAETGANVVRFILQAGFNPTRVW